MLQESSPGLRDGDSFSFKPDALPGSTSDLWVTAGLEFSLLGELKVQDLNHWAMVYRETSLCNTLGLFDSSSSITGLLTDLFYCPYSMKTVNLNHIYERLITDSVTVVKSPIPPLIKICRQTYTHRQRNIFDAFLLFCHFRLSNTFISHLPKWPGVSK